MSKHPSTINTSCTRMIVVATLSGLSALLANAASAQITYQTKAPPPERQANQASQVHIDVMASSHSPTLPIDAFVNDWDATLRSGDLAYIQGRVGVQFSPVSQSDTDKSDTDYNRNQGAISYGLGWRYDYLMSFSEETAEVYWQYENKQSPATNSYYPLLLSATHNERVGANIGYTLPLFGHSAHWLNHWQLSAKANLWQGRHVLDGVIAGDLNTRSQPLTAQEKIRDSIDTVQADIDYYYDKPALGEEDIGWDVGAPDGYGYSLDMALTGQLGEDTRVAIAGYDLLGRMHWQDVSSTQYTLDYDANGRPLYTLEGQLSYQDITQTLPWRVEGSVIHELDDKWQLGLQGQANDVENLYQLSAGYQFDNKHLPIVIKDLAITGLFEPQTDALGVAIDSRYGGLKLLTDDLDSTKSKRAEVSLYGRYSW